jgi:flagellar biosynthesis protein FlhF
MKIKSYYSRSVEDAIATARQELGPDALLVNSRRSLPETKHLGEYEVVFVTDAPGAPEAAEAFATSEPRPTPDRLAADVSDLKRELEAMRKALMRSAYAPPRWAGASSDASEAYATLTAADLSPELARAIVDAAELRMAARPGSGRIDAEALRRALFHEIQSRISVQPALGRGEAQPHIVALVGPPGSGKTTTLVKLAVQYGLASRRPALLLSMDTYRIAAADQLRSYAAILGIAFQVLETTTALAQALEENRGKELILVDTPGLSHGDLDAGSSLAGFLSSRADIDTHLVLPASMKACDLARVVDAFGGFAFQKLLFTKLDETSSFGAVVNESSRTGKPVSFLTSGQRIPEDLEIADSCRIAEMVLSGYCREIGAAA